MKNLSKLAFKKKQDSKKVFDSNLMSEVIASANLEEAFQHVYKKRKKYHHNNDIWYLSSRWKEHKPEIQDQLLEGKVSINIVDIISRDSNNECNYGIKTKDYQ